MANLNSIQGSKTSNLNSAISESTASKPRSTQTQDAAQVQITPRNVTSQMQLTFDRLHHLTEANVKMHNSSLDVNAFEQQFKNLASGSQDVQEAFVLVKAKMMEVNLTMADLDAKNLNEVIHKTNVDPLVKYSINAQNKLKDALGLLTKASGVDFSSQMNMCDRRISETLNFVGKMMPYVGNGGIPDDINAKNFSDNISNISFEMHGSQGIVAGVQKELNAVFSTLDKVYTKLDALEESPHLLNHKEFTSSIQTITKNIKTITDKIDNAQKQNTNFNFENSSINAIKTSLNCAKERLEHLKNVSKHEVVEQLLNDFDKYYLKTGEDFIKFSQTFSRNNNFKTFLLKHFQNMEDVSNALHKNPINSDNILSALQKTKQHYSDNMSLTDDITLCINAAGEKDPVLFQERLEAIRTVLSKNADEHINDFIMPLRTYEQEHPGTIAHASFIYHDTLKMQSEKLVAVLAKSPKNIHETGEFINAAFNSPVNLSTMVEMKMRGFPLRNAQLNATDINFKTDRPLGQGAVNEVFLCTYGQPNGEDVNYVFKGEYGARKGLGSTQIASLGYHNDIYVNSLNVACTEVAELIGCESAIAQAKVGIHKGQFGLFMSVAEGKTLRALNSDTENTPSVGVIKGRNVLLKDLGSSLDDEQQKIFVASLAKELTKLEWSDALTAQLDRHDENYLFTIDPKTFEAKITGIDNDASFSRNMVGVGKMKQRNDTCDFSNPLSDRDSLRLNNSTGVNQMFKPLFISQEIFDKLHSIDEDDYRRLLIERIGASEVESAMSRLQDAKVHAQQLKDKGFCFSENEWNSPELFAKLHHAMEYQNNKVTFLQRNFIARDFHLLRSTIAAVANPQA